MEWLIGSAIGKQGVDCWMLATWLHQSPFLSLSLGFEDEKISVFVKSFNAFTTVGPSLSLVAMT